MKTIRVLRRCSFGPTTQDDLIKLLWTHMSVDEVALSIAENGFYQDEPLLVIPKDDESGTASKFTVVEGNRRVAAVLLLRDEELRKNVGATDLPKIDDARRAELASLPVSIHPR